MKLIYLITLLFLSLLGYSQDKLIKSDWSETEVKLVEITPTEIKYKLWNNLEGPLITDLKTDYMIIEFENGEALNIRAEQETEEEDTIKKEKIKPVLGLILGRNQLLNKYTGNNGDGEKHSIFYKEVQEAVEFDINYIDKEYSGRFTIGFNIGITRPEKWELGFDVDYMKASIWERSYSNSWEGIGFTKFKNVIFQNGIYYSRLIFPKPNLWLKVKMGYVHLYWKKTQESDDVAPNTPNLIYPVLKGGEFSGGLIEVSMVKRINILKTINIKLESGLSGFGRNWRGSSVTPHLDNDEKYTPVSFILRGTISFN